MLSPTHYAAAACLSLAAAGCGAGATPPSAPPSPPARGQASAKLGPEANDAARLDDAALASLSEAVGSRVRRVDVDLERLAGGLQITARGDSVESALARCHAWIGLLSAPPPMDGEPTKFRDERIATLLSELHALRASLDLLPFTQRTMTVGLPALVEARVRALALEPRCTMTDCTAAKDFALLQALSTSAARVRPPPDRGPRHPEHKDALARKAALSARFDAQLATERDEAKAAVAALERTPKDGKAAFETRIAWLTRPLPEGRIAAASIDPEPLRALAFEDALLEAEDGLLAVHYGERHPNRLALAAHRRALRETFLEQRRSAVRSVQVAKVELEVLGPRGIPTRAMLDLDERVKHLRERQDELFVQLGRALAASEPPGRARVRVLSPCAAR